MAMAPITGKPEIRSAGCKRRLMMLRDFVARGEPDTFMRCNILQRFGQISGAEGLSDYEWMKRESHHSPRLRAIFIELIELVDQRAIEIIAGQVPRQEQVDV